MSYQNVKIKGKDYGDYPEQKDSKFYNEGKWNNFINPLLPTDCADMSLIELGCSNGLFLKMAKERGFRNIIGVESDSEECRVADDYRDSLGMDYKIINETINEKFDFAELPVSDVIVLSTFHYHLLSNDFLAMMNCLEHKTCSCLIVSIDDRQNSHFKAQRKLSDVRRYFSNWEEVKYIKPILAEDSLHPRESMYSVLFKSKLKRIKIEDIKGNTGFVKDFTNKSISGIIFDDFVKDFINKSIKDENMDVSKTKYYEMTKIQAKRRRWSNDVLLNFMEDKRDLIYDISKNGAKKPIIINQKNELLDGSHRLITMSELGHKSIITRTL